MNRKKFVWKDRESDLRKVKRFHDPNHRFEVMYYRTNLWVHTKRVEAMHASLIPLLQECYEGFNPKLALLISRYHDDLELTSFDASLQLKLQMTKEQQDLFYEKELDAINRICKHYPQKVEGYWFKDILLHALNKDCREAQSHSLIDKHDGNNESLHEVFAGNIVFLEPVINYTQEIFSNRVVKFPMIKEMFASDIRCKSPFLSFPVVDLMELFSKGNRPVKPHTPWTVSLHSGIPAYEAWKEITLNNFPNGMDLLINQTEFHQ